MTYLRGIYLIARREYLAYVGAWGFWVSLITTPLLIAIIAFAPLLLGQAEPTRYVTVIADRPDDAHVIRDAFESASRDAARSSLWVYAQTAAPQGAAAALAAFDAGADRERAISAGRAALDKARPGAGARFAPPPARYEFVLAPSPDLEDLKPYLRGEQMIGDAVLFAAFIVRGKGADRKLEYWSTNLTDDAPFNRARAALSESMMREALAQYGLQVQEAARIQKLAPSFAQFDPRAGGVGEAVTLRERTPFYIAIGLSVLLWSSIFGVANMLLTGVLEEKSNKILDALMTSVSPLQILTGKLIGVAAVSMTLFLVWGGFAFAGLSQAAALGAQSPLAGAAQAALDPGIIATFLICFATGYLMYGAIFLGLGALCDSLQEAQTLLGPVFFLLTGPLLLLGPALVNPKSPIVVGASWIPPFTPFVMMMRAPAGLSLGEAAGPVAVLLVTLVLVLVIAARVFRAGVSHQVKLADILKRFARKTA